MNMKGRKELPFFIVIAIPFMLSQNTKKKKKMCGWRNRKRTEKLFLKWTWIKESGNLKAAPMTWSFCNIYTFGSIICRLMLLKVATVPSPNEICWLALSNFLIQFSKNWAINNGEILDPNPLYKSHEPFLASPRFLPFEMRWESF